MATDTTIVQPTSRLPANGSARGEPRTDHAALPPIDERPRARRIKPSEHQRLSNEITGMAESIREVDPRAADRLVELSRSLDDEETRSHWADVDLRRAFNTERIAHAWAVKKEGGYASSRIEVASRIRDVLVLVPLAITWFAFYRASQAYERYLAENPEESGTPMLVLWERGFGEEGLFVERFSTVALIDVVIIGVIIFLTFYSQGRRDQRDDDIAMTANQLQTDLDNALGAATVALAPDRAGRSASLANSVERLAARFDRNSQELIDRLQNEHQRLELISSRREKEFADFAVFASGMRAGAEETHRLLVDLRQVSSGLQNALEDLTSEVGLAGDQQRTLLGAVSNLERLVASGIQSDQAVTRQLSDAAGNLADAADRALAGSEAAAQAGRVAGDAVRGIADIAAMLAEAQQRVEQAVAGEADSNGRLAEALRGSIGGVTSSTRQLTDISGILAQLRDEFDRLSRHSLDQTSALMQQLESVTNTLNRFANQLPTPDAMQLAFTNALRESNGQPPLRAVGAPTAMPRRDAPEPPARQPGDRPSLWPSSTRRPGQ